MSKRTTPMRRFGDAISPLNERIHDEARLLLADIALADRLGLEIINAEIGYPKRHLLVFYGPACTGLGGEQILLTDDGRYMEGKINGTVFRWLEPLEEAA